MAPPPWLSAALLFSARFDLDDDEPTTSKFYLDAEMYASSSEASPGLWVLLGKASGKSKGKRPMASRGTDAKGKAVQMVSKMSEEEKSAMRALLMGEG